MARGKAAGTGLGSEGDLVVHVAGGPPRRGAAAAAAVGAAVEHGQLAAIGAQHDLGAVAVLTGLVLPFARLELALDIDLGALAQVLLGHARERLGKDRDRVPLGLFAPLAGVAILPLLGGGDAKVADLAPVLEGAGLGVAAEIADDDDLVDGAGHDALL